jgi:hypothetical protein
MLELRVRKFYTFIEHIVSEAGQITDWPLRKVAAVAVIENPYVGRYDEDLEPLIAASAELGRELASLAVAALGSSPVQSYGKGAIVGTAGEQEHGNALLTTTFAAPLREAIGGGKAWIPSITKVASAGASTDVPLASKDALYVRSHYDGMTITLNDAPLPNEAAVIIVLANRGRLNARVGGLKLEHAIGSDGLY